MAKFAAAERSGTTLSGFQVVRTKNGSNQGQNLALTALFVPSSLDSGTAAMAKYTAAAREGKRLLVLQQRPCREKALRNVPESIIGTCLAKHGETIPPRHVPSFGASVLWCFVLNPHCRPRYPTLGVIKESYD
jgi:hypothetical protein